MKYHLPDDIRNDWALNQTRGFEPNERQMLVIEAVRLAIEEAKLFYTNEVYAFSVKLLMPDAEILSKNTAKVDGGDVGMDIYYARRYIDARKAFAREDAAAAKLKPMVGMKLGKLRLQNLKSCTASVITNVAVDSIIVDASLGPKRIRLTTDARGIAHMMDLAFELGQRETNFEQFCSGLLTPASLRTSEPAPTACLSLF